ncbi:MAG TPA: DUF4332 domain-containing protein, partial [Leucothrix sp.]|nr:DUF4332 domain-containing protein [Leucothrix sp.]
NEEADELLYNYKKQNKLLNAQIFQLTGKIKGKENNNLTLAKSLSKIRESKQEVSKELDTINNELQNLRQSNNDLLAEKNKLDKKLKVAKSENFENTKELKKQLTSIKDEYTNLQSKLTDADIYIKELERKQIDLNDLIAEKNNIISSNRKSLDQSIKTISSLENEKKSLEKKLDDINFSKNDITVSLKKELDLSNTANKELKNKLTNSATYIEELERTQIDLNTLIANKNSEIKDKNTSLDKYKELLSLAKIEAKKNIEFVESKLSNAENDIKKLSSESSDNNKKIEKYKESIEKYQHSINQLNNEIISLRCDHTKQKSIIEKLESASSNNKSNDNENQSLKNTAPTEKKSKSLFTNKSLTPPNITVHINKLNATPEKSEAKYSALFSRPKDKESTHKKQSRLPIETIEGIDTVYSKKLHKININFIDTLLAKGKTPSGRNSLAQRTDIDESLITTWVQNADLLRLDGLTADHAKLLHTSRIHDIRTLGKQEQSALYQLISTTNKEKSLSPKIPSKEQLGSWINAAKKLETKINYTPENKTKLTKQKDALTLIKGIGSANEAVLHKLGITTFQQIANFSKEDEVKIGSKLSSFHDRIAAENWVDQAKALMSVNKK